MRTITTSLQAHLENEVQTVALCWRIKRRDNINYYFTDHDRAIVWDGDTYTPIESGSPSNYRHNSDLSPNNIDFDWMFNSTSGRDAELRAGLFDYAQMWTFRINWDDVSTASGIVKLAYGRLGEVQIKDEQAKIELRTLTQILSNPIGSIYTPECQTSLGSTLCNVLTTSTVYTRTGAVDSLTDNQTFIISGDAAGQEAKFYKYGKITFSSGENDGITMQVSKYSTTNEIELYEPLPYSLSTGDTFTAVAGCNRRFAICKSRFNNKDNFRGFPHIPGMDKALTVPANQKWTED